MSFSSLLITALNNWENKFLKHFGHICGGKKALLPSLALIRALFATMLSISMKECVFFLQAVLVYLSKAAEHPAFIHTPSLNKSSSAATEITAVQPAELGSWGGAVSCCPSCAACDSLISGDAALCTFCVTGEWNSRTLPHHRGGSAAPSRHKARSLFHVSSSALRSINRKHDSL